MKLAIMQPYFLPYIGYFQLIESVDKFVIYDDVNFIKKGWINRNSILLNEKAHLFSLPISGVSQNKKIRELKLADNKTWQRKFLSTLALSYAKAPYYQNVRILLERIFSYHSTSVADFIAYSLQQICNYLTLSTSIISSSNIYMNAHLIGEARIIDICLQEKTSIYINAAGGKNLYDKSSFLENKIELKFLCGIPPEYSQFNKSFVSGLSIIDVLMFNSKEKTLSYIHNYRLD
jgi:hypothetical protein